ncbi:MAG: ABC transporter substrate-binding protein [Fimbriimonadaceae bacterium]|nr:ABC transporter substrate-binding protein [Fimbriimonadaceae bacterium]
MTWKQVLLPLSASVIAGAIIAGCTPSTPAEDSTTGGTSTTGTTSTSGSTGESTSARPAPKGGPVAIEGNEIKLGLVVSRGGDLRPWGVDCENGANLAMSELEGGKIGDYSVKLMIQDSNSNPAEGKSAAGKLVNDGASVLIGEVASGITATMAEVSMDTGVPIVAVGATRTDLSQKVNNFFRVCYTDAFQGPVMANFAYFDLGLRKVALVTDKSQPYSTGLSDSFRQIFTKLGGEIVDEQFYQSKDTQFGAIVTNLKSSNPDGLFLSGYFNEVGPLARQLRDAGIKAPLMGGDGWDSAELISSGGDAIVGGYFCNHYNAEEDRPVVKSFLDAFKAKYSAPPATTMGALGYDATKLVLDALKRAIDTAKAENKPLDTLMITNAIENTENFNGVSGVITLKGQNGDPLKTALVVEVQKTGFKFAKSFKPEDIKGVD